jgi:hypothetical protein
MGGDELVGGAESVDARDVFEVVLTARLVSVPEPHGGLGGPRVVVEDRHLEDLGAQHDVGGVGESAVQIDEGFVK